MPFPSATIDADRKEKDLMILLKDNLLGTEPLFEMRASHLEIVSERGITSS